MSRTHPRPRPALRRRTCLPVLLAGALMTPAVAMAPAAQAAVLAPTDVVATRAAGDRVSISWQVPGSQSATSYIASAYTSASGSVTWDVCGAAGAASTTCDPGDAVDVPRVSDAWISVAATDGVTTQASARVRLEATPAAPSAPTLTAGDGGLAVSWTWAAAGAGVTPTGYTATAYSAASGGSVVGTPCSAASAPCTITGLTNGVTVFVEVVASSAAGDSSPSSRTSGAASGAPGAPTALEVQGGDTVVTATWAPPTSTGGSAISAYRAQAYDASSGGSLLSSCEPASLTALHCALEGIANGVSAFVEVSATNDWGTGPASARVEVRTGARPTAPRSVAVDRGDGTLIVTWAEPVSDGGSALTGYLARAYASSTSSTVLGSCTGPAGSTGCTISGVANTSTYAVSVVASTLVGQGPPSARVLARPSSAPTAPRSVTAVRGDGYAAVSWLAPASTNGTVITKYIARAYRTATDPDPIAECSPVDRALRCNLGPLPNGTTWHVDVVAITARYTSEPSSPRVAVLTGTPPTPPREVTAVQSGRDVVVRWRVPVADGGRPITSYTATAFSARSAGTSRGTCTTSGDACTISGLTGAPVHVSVTAANEFGASTASAPRVRVVLQGAPSEPRQVSAHRRGPSVQVSWLRSLDDGGTPVSGYRVRVLAGASVVGTCTARTPRGPLDTRLGCAASVGSAGRPLTAEVTAVNAVTATSADPVAVGGSSPGVPRGLIVLPADRALIATAGPSISDHGAAVFAFRAWSKARGGSVLAACDAGAVPQPSCTLSGLRNYAPVWVDVRAREGAARSAPTARVRAVPMASPPSAPRDVTARWEDGRLAVRWQPPRSDGGYPVTSTTVTVADAATGGSVLGTCRTSGATTGCAVDGLTAEYVFVTVQAVNPVGAGAVSPPLGRNRG